MAATERIIYVPDRLGKRGRLAPGQPMPCRTPHEAIRRAERAFAAGSVAGAHIVRVISDEDAGDVGEPEYLAAFGTVPEPE